MCGGWRSAAAERRAEEEENRGAESQSDLSLTRSFQGPWTHQKCYCVRWLIESDNSPWTQIVRGFNVLGLAFNQRFVAQHMEPDAFREERNLSRLYVLLTTLSRSLSLFKHWSFLASEAETRTNGRTDGRMGKHLVSGSSHKWLLKFDHDCIIIIIIKPDDDTITASWTSRTCFILEEVRILKFILFIFLVENTQKWWGKKKPLPPINNEPFLWSQKSFASPEKETG